MVDNSTLHQYALSIFIIEKIKLSEKSNRLRFTFFHCRADVHFIDSWASSTWWGIISWFNTIGPQRLLRENIKEMKKRHPKNWALVEKIHGTHNKYFRDKIRQGMWGKLIKPNFVALLTVSKESVLTSIRGFCACVKHISWVSRGFLLVRVCRPQY